MEKLVIPSSVTVIADDAMDNCDNLKIYTEEGTYVCTYAVEKGIPCVIIDSSGNILYEQVEDEEFGELKYGSCFWEGKDTFDEDYLENLPVVNVQDDMASLVELKDIIIKHHDHMHVILTINCKWNKEMGMGSEIENNEITVIGYELDVL